MYHIFYTIFEWPAFSFAAASSAQATSSNPQWMSAMLFGDGQTSLPRTIKDIRTFHTFLQLQTDPGVDMKPYPSETVCDPDEVQVCPTSPRLWFGC
jgi:hypothetical protein